MGRDLANGGCFFLGSIAKSELCVIRGTSDWESSGLNGTVLSLLLLLLLLGSYGSMAGNC